MEEEGGELDPAIVSSCMYVENKTLERCVQSIIETVSDSFYLHTYIWLAQGLYFYVTVFLYPTSCFSFFRILS